MKTALIYTLSLLLCASPADDFKMVYRALDSGSLEEIKRAISKLDTQTETSLLRAYKGALYAKEAAQLKGVADKVKAFKKGATMLEDEIAAQPGNVEYRFLRLAIQENSPAILGYQDDIEEDKKMIVQHYGQQSARLRKQIALYAEKSDHLKPEELSR